MTIEGNAESIHSNAVEILKAFKARLVDQNVPHPEEISSALGKVLADAPENISVGQNVINEAVAHYKGKVSVDGVKEAFNIIADKLEGIQDDVKGALKTKIQEKDLLHEIGEKLAALPKEAGKWAKLKPGSVEIAGKTVKNYGWSEGLGKEISEKSYKRLGIRALGAAGAGAILVSGVKDLVGRTDPANDNQQEPERHVVKGLMKTAVGLGVGTVSLFNQTLGKDAKIIAAGIRA